MENRKKIAAIITTYFPNSHADVIATKYMEGSLMPRKSAVLAQRVICAYSNRCTFQ